MSITELPNVIDFWNPQTTNFIIHIWNSDIDFKNHLTWHELYVHDTRLNFDFDRI